MSQLKEWIKKIRTWDERRKILVPGDKEAAIAFCLESFLEIGRRAIEERHAFFVALSGGSTPKSVFQALSSKENRHRLDWKKVFVFWSDERTVPPDHQDSNYRMAMDAGFQILPIPPKQIFRMEAEKEVEQAALDYEETVRQMVPEEAFDLILLGMGSDGHTASLFPHTHGLHAHEERLVIGNYIPQKDTWRMTFSFSLINRARNIHLYVLGDNKAEVVKNVLSGPFQPDLYPVQRVGTAVHPALWIMDNSAAQLL